jgi:hypothetical protein
MLRVTRNSSFFAVGRGDAPQVVLGPGAEGHWWGKRRFYSYLVQDQCRHVGGLLFAPALKRGFSLHESRVHRLGMARD